MEIRLGYSEHVQGASGINVLFGLWLLTSPFLFDGDPGSPSSVFNTALAGIVITLFAGWRYFRPHEAGVLSRVNFFLGVWTTLSPLLIPYATAWRLWNNVLIGMLIAAFALWSATASAAELQDKLRSRPYTANGRN